MDIMVFTEYTIDSNKVVDYPNDTLTGAKIVPNLTSKMWVERFSEPGEFEFTAPVYSDILDDLPIGSLVSHVDSQEVMIVENHEFTESKDGKTEIKVSGRSFEVYLENRVIGQDGILNQSHSNTGYINPFAATTTGETWNGFGGKYYIQNTAAVWNGSSSPATAIGNFQRPSDSAMFLINRLLGTPEAVYPNQSAPHNLGTGYPLTQAAVVPYTVPNADTVNFVTVCNLDATAVPTYDSTWIYTIDRTDALTAVQDILQRDRLGIKTHRPGPSSPLILGEPHSWPSGYADKLAISLFHGQDRTQHVSFTYAGGDISESDYLFSNKNERNSALVIGEFRGLMIRNQLGYKQRSTIIDASDIDIAERISGSALPAAPATLRLIDQYRLRSKTILARRELRRVNVLSAKLVSQQKDLRFRRDYDTGHLVTVIGNHGLKQTMMVEEYVEIEDENGEISYPSLTLPPQGS